MGKLFQEETAYESILFAYFSEEMHPLNVIHNERFQSVVERFMEMLEKEDKHRGSMHTEIVKTIYSNPDITNKVDFHKQLQVSISTLRRYRKKYSATLKTLVEDYSNKIM